RAPSAASTFRSSACAQAAPKAPVLAPTTTTGLFRRAFVATGRETQSIAFFKCPGMDVLYSGVAKRTAPAFPVAAFRPASLAARKRVVPIDPELRAVDLRGQTKADALVSVGIGHRRGHRPGQRYRPGDALDRQVPVDRDLSVAVETNVLGCEAELWVPLGV